MRDIAVGEAQVGDVVAEPVANSQGRVLLPKGARLSAAVLSRLAGWGVARLLVEGEEPEEVAAEEAATQAAEELDHRFSEWEGDDLMMAIKQVAHQHLNRR